MSYVKVAELSQIPPGKMLPVRVGDEDVVLYNVGGRIFATRDSCTHQYYPLSKGYFRGKYIKCPLHGWEYDVTTGQYQGNPSLHVRCFSVKVEGDDVLVEPQPQPPPPEPPPPQL